MVFSMIIFGYFSLFIELFFFHLPSTSNTQFLLKLKPIQNNTTVLLNKIQHFNQMQRIFLLVIPHLIIIVGSIYPLVMIVLQYFTKSFLIQQPSIIIFIGLFCIIVGRILTFYSMLFLRRKLALSANNLLIKTNIFSYSRNPGLDGMFLFFIGIGFLINQYYVWLYLVYYFFYMNFKVNIEEEYLYLQFDETYIQYKLQTPKYLFQWIIFNKKK